MKQSQILTLPIGMILLAIAILIEKYSPQSNCLDFIIGLLLGLSVLLNIAYIYFLIRKIK